MKKRELTQQTAVVLSQETHDLLVAITDKLQWSKSEFIRVMLKERLKEMKKEVLEDE